MIESEKVYRIKKILEDIENRQTTKRYKIITVDFDGCLVENNFPKIGKAIPETIKALKTEISNGAKIILWTCRKDEHLKSATQWCEKQGIKLDAINNNLPEMIKYFGGDTRKIYADEYWDDKAVRMPKNT